MAAPPAIRQRPDRALVYAALVIIAGVLATTLAQTQILARLPLQNLLKNELHADRTANAAFLLIVTPHEYRALLFVVIVINTFMMVTSTVVGGYMVETAQASSGSGRLTALRQFVQQGCWIVNGPAAGYLASIAFGWTAAACGSVMFLLVPVTLLFLQEQRRRSDPRLLLQNARGQLVKIATARTMWGAAGLMALFYIAPGFATALFYKQQNELHLGTQAQGFLQLIAGVCGVVAAVGYGILCRRLNLRTLLVGCMIFATAANLGYLFYGSAGRAQAIEGLNGFGYTLAELALMDLAVRATPAGSEGAGLLVDGQRPQSGALRDRLVRLAFARRISFFVRQPGARQLADDVDRGSSGVSAPPPPRHPQRCRDL
jgi:hypothetical protein